MKTAYDVRAQKPLARAVMVVSNAHRWFNRAICLYNKFQADPMHELKYLKKVKGSPHCIQLQGNYDYIGIKDKHKFVYVLDMANGDVASLLKENLSEKQLLEISSQMIAALMSLSKKNVWHGRQTRKLFVFQ